MSEPVNPSGLAPLGHAVLLKPYEVKERSKGGIIIPDTSRERDMLAEQRAVVIEIGPECWADERTPRCEAGDKVLFSKWAGYIAEGPADGQKYRVVNDRDIFMRIDAEVAHDG